MRETGGGLIPPLSLEALDRLLGYDELHCPRCDAERGIDAPDGCRDPQCWSAWEIRRHYDLPAVASLGMDSEHTLELLERAWALDDRYRPPSPPPIPPAVLRAELRATVADYLRHTTRGERGAGRTAEWLLAAVRYLRRQHAESIRAERREAARAAS